MATQLSDGQFGCVAKHFLLFCMIMHLLLFATDSGFPLPLGCGHGRRDDLLLVYRGDDQLLGRGMMGGIMTLW